MVADVILEIIKIVFPAAIVFATAWFLLKNMLDSQGQLRLYEVRRKEKRETIGLRLQAYERLALFLERISPGNLIPRVRNSGMNVKELQIELISHIRHEYEHNLSQQIYVGSELWDTINYSKNDLIKVINLLSTSMPPDEDSMVLARAVLDHYIKSEQGLPTEKALDLLKMEVRKLFQ